MRCFEYLKKEKLIEETNDEIGLAEKKLKTFELYRVRRAIILAAGFGSRMIPATVDHSKPMVQVIGVRIIDILLDVLIVVGIKEIIAIGGYQLEMRKDLHKKVFFYSAV